MARSVRERLTYLDWLKLPESKLRTELIDGRIEVSSSPVDEHQAVTGEVYSVLKSWVRDHWDGVVFSAPSDVPLDDFNVVQPDVVVWDRPTYRRRRASPLGVCPPLVIEVLSKNTQRKDRVERRARYARYGIHEYWIIDWRARSIEVLVLEAGAYRSALLATGDAAVTSSVLPGFRLPASDLFAVLDDLLA